MIDRAFLATMPKPFDEMTVAELRAERDYWDRYVNDRENTGPSVGIARDLRTAFDGMIARREGRQP